MTGKRLLLWNFGANGIFFINGFDIRHECFVKISKDLINSCTFSFRQVEKEIIREVTMTSI